MICYEEKIILNCYRFTQVLNYSITQMTKMDKNIIRRNSLLAGKYIKYKGNIR